MTSNGCKLHKFIEPLTHDQNQWTETNKVLKQLIRVGIVVVDKDLITLKNMKVWLRYLICIDEVLL